MPRTRNRSVNEPLLARLLVADRHRLTLPAGSLERLPWISAAEGGGARMELGARGGLALRPEGSTILRGAILERVAARSLVGLERSVVGDYSRLVAMSWPVKIDPQHRLTLPEEVRKLGLLPGLGGGVVLWVFAGLAELWLPDEWLAFTRGLAAREGFEADAEEYLDGL